MKITHLNNNNRPFRTVETNSAVALGNFDGMHIGHQEIVKNCVVSAKECGLVATVVTFSPHPQAILYPERRHYHLITLEEKLKYIENLGIEQVLVINFDREFANLSPQEFTAIYLQNMLRTKWLFTGYNFYFGHDRQGDVAWLQNNAAQFNFEYRAVTEISANYHTVSSSNIKRLLKLGAVGIVSKLLGRPFAITAVVVKGKGLGGPLLQVPTANIEVDPLLALPLLGVYLVKVMHNGISLYGVANIGNRPSLNEVATPLLEVYLFDVNIDLYGQILTVEFMQFLRPERKFDDIEALKSQIHMDIRVGKYVLSNGNLTYALEEVSSNVPGKQVF